MAGFGDLWNPNLHPRGWHGRFVKSFHLADWLQKTIDNFKPRTFHSNGQAGQYAMNLGHRSPGGAFAAHEMSRIHNDWDEAMDHIRHGDIDPTTKKFMDTMDRHMQPAPEGMILGRTFTPEALGLRPDQLDENNPQGITSMMGNTLQDKGYGITHLGTNDGHGPGKITMTILAPQGTRVAFSGQNANDRGVFLDKEQRILVTHVDPDGQGGWYMMGVAEPKGATTGTPESTLQGRKGAGLTEAQREAKISAPSTVNRNQAAPPSAPAQQANVQGMEHVAPAQVPARTPAQEHAKAARRAGYQSAAAQEAKQAGAAATPTTQAPDVYNGHKFTPAEAKVLDYMGTGSAGHYHTNPGSKAADKKAFEDLHKLGLLDKRSGEKGPGYKPNDEGWKVIHARGGGHGPGSKAYAEEQAAKAAAGAPPAPSEPTPNAPQAPQAVTPQPAPTAPSVGTRTEPVHGPIGGTPTEGKSPSEIAGTPPEPSPPPAPAAPAPQRNFREAFHEAGLEFPSPGARRAQMNKVYAGLTSGKMHPQDALRQTESDIKHNEGLLKDMGPNDPKAKSLEQDIKHQQKFADLIAKENNLPREGNVSPAPPEHLGKPEAAPAPVKAAKKAAKAAPTPKAEAAPAPVKAAKAAPARKFAAPQVGPGETTRGGPHGVEVGDTINGKKVASIDREGGRFNFKDGEGNLITSIAPQGKVQFTKGGKAEKVAEAAAPEPKKATGFAIAKNLSPEERKAYDSLDRQGKASYLARRRAGQSHEQALGEKVAKAAPAKAAPVKAAKAVAPAAAAKAVDELHARREAAGLPHTVTGLRQAAREKKIRGFSTMNKDQLSRALLGEEVPKAEKALVSPEKLGPHIQAAKTENDAKALMADHTLADLRELAKANGVDLKGKRTKPQVQDAILKHLRGEETTGIKPEHVTESLNSELKKASVVTPDGPEGDGIRKALSEVDQNDPESLRKERDNLEKEAARLRAAGDRPAAHLAQGAADVLGMRAQRISGVEEAAPAKKIEKAAVPAGHEDLGGTKNDLMEIGKREGAPVKTAMTKPQLIKAITDHRAGKEPVPTPAQAARAAKKAAPTGETHLGEAKGRTGKLAGRTTPSERIPEGQRVQPQGVRETPAPGAEFTPEQMRRLERNGIVPKKGAPTPVKKAAEKAAVADAVAEGGVPTHDDLGGIKFDPTQAKTFKPVTQPKRARFVKGPGEIDAEWGEKQRFSGDHYLILNEKGEPAYGSAAKEWEDMHSRIPGTEDGWQKTATVEAFQYHGTPTTHVTTMADGTTETKNTVNDGDWVVKQKNGEVQIIKDEKFKKLYDHENPVSKAAPRTPAQMAAGKKAVPKGSVKGERAQVPVTTAPRQSEFRKAWDKAQAGADRSKMDPTSVRSMDEVGKDLESGKITPEEGIRRLESDISLNHDEINDINREIRAGNVQGAELDKLRGQRDKLVSANSHLEHVSRSMHQHFGKERVTPTEVKAEIPANALETINNASPEEMKQAARQAGLGDIEGSTGREVFDNAIRKMVQQRYEELGAKKPSKAAKAATPVKLAKAAEPKPEFAPGGAKHLDAKAIAGDLNISEEDLKHVQDELNTGKTPGQVGRDLERAAQVRKNANVYLNGGWPHREAGHPLGETSPEQVAADKANYDKELAQANNLQELANRLKTARRPVVRKAAVPKASEEIAQAKQETKSPAAKKALAKAETAVKGAEQEAENLKQRIIKRHSDAWDGANTRQEAEAAAQNMRGDLTLAEIRDWAKSKGITGRSKDDILKKAVDQRFPGPTPQRRDVMAARMEKASQIRNVGEALAQIDQLKNDQATERAMTTRIEGHAKVRNLDPALTKRLVENHGNQSELDKIAAEHGLVRNTEGAGQLVPYNPHTMQAIDPQNPREGSPVRVISPGFEGTADQRKFQAVKAKVQHAPEARAEMEKAQRVAVGQRLARSHQGPAAEPMLSPEAEKARRTEEVASNMARLNAAKAVATKESPEQLVERLNSFDNPMSREEANAALANHTKAELVDIAKRMNIPRAQAMTKDNLRAEIVQAGPGQRLQSIATRGFSGARPGEEAPKGSTARKLAEEVRAATAEVTKGGSNPVKATKALPHRQTPKQIAQQLKSATSTEEGNKILGTLPQSRAQYRAMANEVGIEVAPNDTMAKMHDKILRQAVTRRVEHEAYLRRANPVTATGLAEHGKLEGAALAKSSAPVKRAHIRDFGSGLTAKLGRENGDEKLKLPNGGADQGLLHMDSSIGGLWQDLASDNRVPNSTVNEITDIGHNLGTGKIDVPTARALIRGIKTDDPAVRERINQAVADLEVKPSKYQVPENTPKEIRDILDKLNEIPAYHNKAPGQAGSGETPFQKVVDLVHAIGNGDEGPGGDMKLIQAIQNPHESGDGVYAARKLAHPIAPGGSQSPEVRNWFRSWRNKESVPSVEVTPPRNQDAALARERATKAVKAAPKPTQAELRNPVAKVGNEAPKAPTAVTTKGLTEGEGIPISNRLALENKLSNRNTLNAMDRAVRHENTRAKVPELFQTLMTQLQNAGVGPNDEPRKSLIAWYKEHFI